MHCAACVHESTSADSSEPSSAFVDQTHSEDHRYPQQPSYYIALGKIEFQYGAESLELATSTSTQIATPPLKRHGGVDDYMPWLYMRARPTQWRCADTAKRVCH